jgi:hypothetical protein
MDSMLDFITLTYQPSSGSVFAGSFGGGLLEITKDNNLVIYKQQSLLQPAIGDPRSYRVGGLATDLQNNVWISNYGAPQNIIVKKSDGIWKRFSIPFFHLENAVGGITIDDYDQKWIISQKATGYSCLIRAPASIIPEMIAGDFFGRVREMATCLPAMFFAPLLTKMDFYG